MAHSKADVIDSRQAWIKATKDQIDIYRGLIAALDNALRGMDAVTAGAPVEEAPAPASRIGKLAQQLAGNGQ